MNPEEIYRRLGKTIELLGSIKRRDIFSANEQALMFICYDNLVEVMDLLASKLPSVESEG